MAKSRVVDHSRKVLARIDRQLYNRVDAATNFLNGEVRRRAPYRTGNLRNSYFSRVFAEGTAIIGQVFTNVHYALHAEFGTVKWKGKPHLRPAIRENKKQLKAFIRGK